MIAIKKLQERLRSGKIKIVSAPRIKVERHLPYIHVVLQCLGHPEAYVTDESSVWDFCSSESIPKDLVDLSKKHHFRLFKHTLLWQIGAQLSKSMIFDRRISKYTQKTTQRSSHASKEERNMCRKRHNADFLCGIKKSSRAGVKKAPRVKTRKELRPR